MGEDRGLIMKRIVSLGAAAGLFALLVLPVAAQDSAPTNAPAELLRSALGKVFDIIQPADDAPAQTFSAELKVARGAGLPREVLGRSLRLAYQAPERLAVTAEVDGETYALGRDGQQLWAHIAGKKFGVVGEPGGPRFKTAPEKKDFTRLPAFKLPVARDLVLMAPMLMKVESLPAETVDGTRCLVLRATPLPQALQVIRMPGGEWQITVQEKDLLPRRVAYHEAGGLDILVEISHPALAAPAPDSRWKIPAREGDKIETTAVSHLLKFLPAAYAQMTQDIPTLPPATGAREVIGTEGAGRLEMIDGTRVLFVKGTPEEMGRQQGVLLKKEVRNLVDRILYGVGVGSSLSKGRWFFGEIEAAQSRLAPFIDARYLREMDAMALAAGLEKEEVRLANFFPELFHCSGFALYGAATADGHMYHGRVLDYLRGMGLEQNAVVMVMQPDRGHAWVNVSYAGFVGSVTAMNEKHIAIGEMGGRGEGNWDGKPMAQLLREVMEKASTIEEAVDIMRKGPRTCEYYYVISDGTSKRAVGIAATPEKFETVWAGESHPKLPRAFKDAVLMSAGDRYTTLADRVQANHGKFDAGSARDLMTRPVSMNSNIHCALFAPDTLDFWVANADSKNVASHTRYTHYNLGELLHPAK